MDKLTLTSRVQIANHLDIDNEHYTLTKYYLNVISIRFNGRMKSCRP